MVNAVFYVIQQQRRPLEFWFRGMSPPKPPDCDLDRSVPQRCAAACGSDIFASKLRLEPTT